MRIDQSFKEACRRHSDRCAVAFDGERVSYANLAALVADRAKALDRVLGRYRRTGEGAIGIYAANSLEYLVSYYAILHSGRVPFLIDPQFGQLELEEIWLRCGVSVFLTEVAAASFPLACMAVHLDGSDAQLLLAHSAGGAPCPKAETGTCRFTSGTTGRPKCLEFSHHAVVSAAENWAEGTGLSASDRTLCLASFCNGLAFNTSLLSTFLVGAELHVSRGLPLSSRIIRQIEESRATRLVAFPVVYRLLASSNGSRGKLGDLRLGISAGAALDGEVKKEFERRFEIRIADYYGIAEVGPCTFERDGSVRAGLGTPLPGVFLGTRPVGEAAEEVIVRTSSMATCYLNHPGLLESRMDDQRLFHTGDLGHISNCRLFITGRLDALINLAGRKVDPTELEAVALTVPGVRDAAAFAESGADSQPYIHLVVASESPVARVRVLEACRARLASFKVPSMVTRVADIPRSSSGKPRNLELRQMVQDAGHSDFNDSSSGS
jgi:HIP---CoA ligase